MAEVNVLVIVDVLGAATNGGLANNVWMIDTGKYLGTQECGNELVTLVNQGDTVAWTVTAVDPGTNVQFASGQPFTTLQTNPPTIPSVINPQQNPINTAQFEGRFSPPGGTAAGTTYQYSIALTMDGQTQSFDPFLKLATAT